MNLQIKIVAPNGVFVAREFPRDTDVQDVLNWATLKFLEEDHLRDENTFLVFNENRVLPGQHVENYAQAGSDEIRFHLRQESIPSGGSESAFAGLIKPSAGDTLRVRVFNEHLGVYFEVEGDFPRDTTVGEVRDWALIQFAKEGYEVVNPSHMTCCHQALLNHRSIETYGNATEPIVFRLVSQAGVRFPTPSAVSSSNIPPLLEVAWRGDETATPDKTPTAPLSAQEEALLRVNGRWTDVGWNRLAPKAVNLHDVATVVKDALLATLDAERERLKATEVVANWWSKEWCELDKENDALRAKVMELEAANRWLPVSEWNSDIYPKRILVWNGVQATILNMEFRSELHEWEYSGWRPLPSGPVAEVSDGLR